MTVVPPPVPPEIAERLRLAISDPGHFTKRGERYTEPISSWQARAVIAAVCGDIVEAARRDALDAAINAVANTLVSRHCTGAALVVMRDAVAALSATVDDGTTDEESQ